MVVEILIRTAIMTQERPKYGGYTSNSGNNCLAAKGCNDGVLEVQRRLRKMIKLARNSVAPNFESQH